MPDNSGTGAPIASAAVPGAQTNQTSSNTVGDAAAVVSANVDYRKIPHKLKVNEREEEVTYDDLVRDAQKFRASSRVFDQAAAKERKMGQLIERAKKGDLSWIEDMIGEETFVKAAENRLLKVVDWNKMSPEQQDAYKERQRADAAEKELNDRKSQEKARESQIEIARATKAIDKEMNDAFSSMGMKPTPEMISWAADYMRSVMPDEDDEDQDYEPMLASEGLSRANRRFERDIVNILPSLPKEQRLRMAPLLVSALMNEMSIEELRAVLPQDFTDGLRKANIRDVEGQDPIRRKADSYPSPTTKEAGRSSKSRRVAQTTDEAFAQLDEHFKKQVRR